jgi:P27 family predicted phage terminase small subunit
MIGRPPKPTHLKLVTGTARKNRLNKHEPKPQRGLPKAPVSLSNHARRLWPALCASLDRMGVLTEADGLALASLCEAYSDLQNARDALAARGDITYETMTMTGVIHRAYPEVAMIGDADRRVRMWLAAFGMTPSDRVRVTVNGEQQEEPTAKYLA